MIRETLGFRITQVPGLVEIRIEPSASSERGVHIVLDDGMGDPRSYGLEELVELSQALYDAVKLAESLAEEIGNNGKVPG